MPIEGFGPIEARLANLEDRIAQLICVTARQDAALAPRASRPDYPHVRLRENARRANLRDLELQLIPGGG
ncbi:hypothetical protein [Nocardia wallacei]|uniref:hypothetical protein n=1 Tax=Nocardia wallacei TaxID=480035 RepID=UPI00245576C4|nr:hypothetical protein [Nocardia wallacei]